MKLPITRLMLSGGLSYSSSNGSTRGLRTCALLCFRAFSGCVLRFSSFLPLLYTPSAILAVSDWSNRETIIIRFPGVVDSNASLRFGSHWTQP